MGRGISAEEAVPNGSRSVVISWDMWQTRLAGDADVLGQTLRLNGIEHTIVGVAERGFAFPDDATVWLPERNDNQRCGRNCLNILVVGRLAEGVTLERAAAEVNDIAARVASVEPINENVRANVVPLAEYLVGDVRRGLRILFGAVGMVLLIACANVATLLFTGATERASQMALRKALGANRGRLVRQMLTESAVLCVAGGALGLLLARWGVHLIGTAAAGSIPRLEDVSLDATVLGYTLLLMTVTTLLFGFAPALLAARGSLPELLRGVGRSGGVQRTRGRSILIGVQVALSVMLLIGTGLMLRTFNQLRSVDLGFDPARVLRFSVALPAADYATPEQRIQFFDQLAERVEASPDVVSTGAIAGSPLGGSRVVSSIERIGVPSAQAAAPNAVLRVTMPGYFETMGIPVLQGRGIEAADRASALPVVVVSSNAANALWPGEDPIGKEIRLGVSVGMPEPDSRTVVGVVGDVRSGSLADVTAVEMYIPLAQAAPASMTFVIRSRGGDGTLFPALRESLRAMDPTVPMRSAGAMRDDVARQLAEPGFYSTLLGAFAGIALLLSAVGLYGLVAYQVARRRREIGIRIAIGARSDALVRMLASMGLRPAFIGLAIGLIAAAAATRALESLLYGVSARDPMTWIGVLLFLSIVTTLAAVIPASRAAHVAPTEVLRGD
jgi:predicted permease